MTLRVTREHLRTDADTFSIIDVSPASHYSAHARVRMTRPYVRICKTRPHPSAGVRA